MAWIAGYRGVLVHFCYAEHGEGFSDALINDIFSEDARGCVLDLSKVKVSRSAMALLEETEVDAQDPDYSLVSHPDAEKALEIIGTGAGVCVASSLKISSKDVIEALRECMVEDHHVSLLPATMDAIDEMLLRGDPPRSHILYFN